MHKRERLSGTILRHPLNKPPRHHNARISKTATASLTRNMAASPLSGVPVETKDIPWG